MSTPIQSSAMLASLNIRQWSARRLDRKVSAEVSKAHGAKDAGNFNKVLISTEALEPLAQIEGAARQYHYSVTLPWGDKGERLLPAKLFMEYTQAMGKYRNEFENRVATLVKAYPQLVQDARVKLGTMYDPSEYPAEIASRFSFRVEFAAVQDANDFRVSLGAEHVEQIKQDIAAAQAVRQAEAMSHIWERVRQVVSNIAAVCSKEKPRFFDSLTENAQQLAAVLPAMNLSNDPQLTHVAHELQALAVPVDTLRKSPVRRRTVAQQAEELLKVLPCTA